MRGFGDLEAVVMQRVWDHGRPVTVREVFEELRRTRVIAYTTVMSTMDNLHSKGWLTLEKEGKAYRSTATASREQSRSRTTAMSCADTDRRAVHNPTTRTRTQIWVHRQQTIIVTNGATGRRQKHGNTLFRPDRPAC